MGYRSAVVGLTSALALGGLALLAPPASASTWQSVTVTVTGDGTHGAVSHDDVHPGVLTLHVKDATSPDIGAQTTVVYVNRGHTIARVLHDLNQQIGNNVDPVKAAASTRDLNSGFASAFAGGDVSPGAPGAFVSDTVFLPRAGTYYIVNTSGATAAVVGKLEARGTPVRGGNPRPDSTIWLGNGASDTITWSGGHDAKGVVRVVNNGNSIHLMNIQKVPDWATDAAVQVEYDNALKGIFPTSPAQDPAGFLNQGPPVATGSDAVTPHNASRLSYDLPAGTYLIQCFVADDVTGIPHAFMGMHLVVHLT